MSEVKVKKEKNVMESADVENRILDLCVCSFPQGITDQVIQNDLPHLEPQQRALALNRLLSL
ncbi:LOW QUALITY PROTEIN: DNA-directed RNA polymerase III subunit RPC6, partial [Menidia menidia]